ncbi:hypothetical protein Fmac_013568 [Flemingia macrophylla]|uniref:Uncharacterized protein n=1 Tax=Flemingia macrophylla TaxID=520843 RepID=A0ABD1MUC3_9FABA
MESVKANPSQLPSDGGPFAIPDFPHRITMCARPPKGSIDFMGLGIEVKSVGLVVNNFAELDGEEYIEHYEKTTGHRAWHVGPACLAPRSGEERAEKSAVSENEFVTWLDSQPPESVVYICFGSLCHFPDKQLYEIACGLEQAGHAFIWVIPEKKGEEREKEEEKKKWLTKGFKERNKEKGMVIRGWTPQLWGDQFYNEKLVCEMRGIGVEVGATEWTLIGYGEREKLVPRDCNERAVRRLMDGGDEAHNIRRRAKRVWRKG